MRGTVEVIAIVENGREEILYREDNLVVNEAGRTIVDMLTTPSSTLTYAPRLMDTSNWVVQAISFGKDPSAYSDNAHRMPERRNMVTYSTPSSIDLDHWWTPSLIISSAPHESPPPAYNHIPSSVAHVVSIYDGDDESNGYLSYGETEDNVNTKWDIGAFSDMWITASMYIKHPHGVTTSHHDSETLGSPYTHFGFNIRGDGYDAVSDYGGSGFSRLGTVIRWDEDKNWADPSGLDLQYAVTNGVHNVDRMVSAGYSEFWQQNGGCNYEGDGWYRVWAAGLAPMVDASSFSMTFYPARWETSPTGESTGGALVYGFQVEPGRWPTDLQFNSNFTSDNWDWSGSVMGSDLRDSPTLSGIGGTVRVSGSVGVSSYTPTNSLDQYPDPLDKKLARTSVGNFDASTSVLSGFDMGQNLNTIVYRRTSASDNGTAAPFLACASGYMTNWQEQTRIITNLRTLVSLSGFDTLGPQAFFQGCYAEGSSTGGSRFALVSSLDTSEAYGVSGEDALVVGLYDGGFNEASSMDVLGFVGKVYDPINNRVGLTGDGVALSGYGLTVSSNAQETSFANNGKVIYETTISSGDAGMCNLYGGIYNIGLWTLDIKESLKNAAPPFVFEPLNNPIEYRLFSSKKFVDNITFIHDDVDATLPAGINAYTDIKIRWTLDFRSTGNA